MRHPSLLVTRVITTWKECVIDMFSIHDSCENIFNVYSKVNIVQLTTLKQTEHERDIIACSYSLTHCLNMMGIEEILHVIGGSGNHYKICVFISCCTVQSCSKIQLLFGKELLDVLILYR